MKYLLALFAVFFLTACNISFEMSGGADDESAEPEEVVEDIGSVDASDEPEDSDEEEMEESEDADESEEDNEEPEEESEESESEDEMGDEDSEESDESDESEELEDPADAAAGMYEDYTEGVVGNGEMSMLFFYASWCGYCQAKDALLTEMYSSEDMPNINTYKVDFDTEEALKAQFGVAMQDTFILIDDEGNAIESIPGASEEDIRGMIFTE
ncbi:thioredoxin family protein [Candidatus Peribacteria bacterium]|jgi:thiol-disulfide isomerase/thioredoxin|nr:thioredoxin family protein [Candidatus Peribacteria bacterium]MBT4020846.1 thioredoxin family protein [Candidatus Peribacteria bacterium]MBT4241135.1 thioredoxin family protein [Candidatus Peribacteria bacterium]MBT4473857.1 thioredoxin family protein [Candidatus Peribacteria bacterium]